MEVPRNVFYGIGILTMVLGCIAIVTSVAQAPASSIVLIVLAWAGLGALWVLDPRTVTAYIPSTPAVPEELVR